MFTNRTSWTCYDSSIGRCSTKSTVSFFLYLKKIIIKIIHSCFYSFFFRTVVKVTIGKSQTLYSSVTRRGKDKNSGLLSIGPVNIDIPQHPVALHGMMTRSSKQLSSTLQELRVGRTSNRQASKQNEEPESPKDIKGSRLQQKRFPATNKNVSGQNGLLQPLVMQFNVLLQVNYSTNS